MKVLVTGGGGFLGSHVCEMFAKNGNEVIAYDNLTKHELSRTDFDLGSARTYNWDFLAELGVELVEGDIREVDQLMETAKGCDFIVHTAAQPAMTISEEEPQLDLSTNVLGTFNVLETARKYDIPVASCSTIHVYGTGINKSLEEGETRYTREPPGISEGHPVMTGTLTPLHASKRSAELYVQTFIETYGLKAANFRLTGFYGPRQFGGEDHGWVAHFTISTILQRPITIFGTGKQVRDILFVSDVAEAFQAFYERGEAGTYNIAGGPKHAISLVECLDLIEEVTGKEPIVKHGPERHGDLKYFVGDISKAKEELGWEPKISNEEGIERLANWVEENKSILRDKK